MSKPLVVIIEDDPQLGNIYSLTLQGNFEIQLIADGDSAIAYLAQVTPELIVLDVHLPGANGQEILAFIHANPHLAGARVILATADSQQADFLEDRAAIVLLKPISPLQLRELSLRLCKIEG